MHQKNTFTKNVWVVLAVTFILVSISGFFVYNSLTNIISDITEEAQPDETVILMKELIYDISDAEKNVKSYSLTSNGEYLENYNEKYNTVQDKLVELEKSKLKDDKSKSDIDSLQSLIALKFELLEDLLILNTQSRVSTVLDKVVDKINTSEGKSLETEEELVDAEKENFFKRLVNKRKEKDRTKEE